MATEIARIQFRRDTIADWLAVDPVLASGEVGYESDTGFYRVGNGSIVFSLLTAQGGYQPFKTVQLLTSDTTLTTSNTAVGDIIEAGGYRYSVVASGGHITTAGGVRVTILHNDDGSGHIDAFGAAGNGATDDTAAFNACAAAFPKVILGEKTYVFDDANIPADTLIIGQGDGTIIKLLSSGAHCFLVDSGSAIVANNIKNLALRDLQVLGTSSVDGFSEQRHLVHLSGVSNVLFENVLFKDFQGDGAYLGSSIIGATERHNENVTFRHCRFDGVGNENRNGISFIDIDGALVENCTFTNATKSTMPGAIDFEPNANTTPVIKNIRIINNTFIDCGGNVADIAFAVPGTVAVAPTNITVEGNTHINSGNPFSYNENRAASAIAKSTSLTYRGNYVSGGATLPKFISGKGIIIEGNTFTDMPGGMLLGYSGATHHVRRVKMKDNKFTRCSNAGGALISPFNIHGFEASGNLFDDCGNGAAGSYIFDFNVGTSAEVELIGNTIHNPNSNTTNAIIKEASHTFTPVDNKMLLNSFAGLSNAFDAEERDEGWTSYTPVIEGSTTAGTGTYTSQIGYWRRAGDMVFFEVRVVQSAHTGTGICEISLPKTAAATSDNVVAISIDGAATTGGQIGIINHLAGAGGITGAIRCDHSGTGTLLATQIPSGAATYRASGSYLAA